MLIREHVMEEYENEKGYQEIAHSPDEQNCNSVHSESDQIECQSAIHLSIIDVGGEKEDCKTDDPSVKGGGNQLYILLLALIDRFISCDEHQKCAIALWIILTWCINAFKIAPILAITALTKGAGKTQVLTLISKLCYEPLSASNITAASLFRAIEKFKPTFLLDEFDTYLKQNEDMRGVINAGIESNGYVIRCDEDFTPVKFNVYCPKALAGIGKLPETIEDRSVVIQMCRKRTSDIKEKLRHADDEDFDSLKDLIANWAQENLEALSKARPEIPSQLSDRKQDCWESLLAIADQLGADVAIQARRAAIALSGKSNDEAPIFEEVLIAIKVIFEKRGVDKISTADLIKFLCEDDEAPWKYFNNGRVITARQLAKLLKEFDITSKQTRFLNMTCKAYHLADFEGSFAKYLE